ncbi:hypothetical protein DLREEDagrD3_29140 [Denitratisoma sp. agr-D3]
MTPQMHPKFDADDYSYLAAKGWSDAEILKRWTEEYQQGKTEPCRWSGAQEKLKATLAAAASR